MGKKTVGNQSINNMEDRAALRLRQRANEELDRLIPKAVIAAFDSGRPSTISISATIRPKPQKDGGGYELVVKGNGAIPGHESRDTVQLNDDLQMDLIMEEDPPTAQEPAETPAEEPAHV